MISHGITTRLTLHTLVAGGGWFEKGGREGGREAEGCASSQVAARYSFVAGSELRENFAAKCSTRRSKLGLTSIEMLNVARRWNKEPLLFSHLLAARIKAVMKFFHLLVGEREREREMFDVRVYQVIKFKEIFSTRAY